LRGEILDIKTDIYSLGLTFYFLLTGKPLSDKTILVFGQEFHDEVKEFL